MGQLLIRIAKWVMNLVLPIVGCGFALALYRLLQSARYTSSRWIWFFAGVAVFTVVWSFGRRYAWRAVQYLATLEHEITHILIGLLFLKRPLSIKVSATHGGEVRLTGSNMWIALAPYFFPTVSLVVILTGAIFALERHPLFIALVGASTVYHLASTWSEFSVLQDDFRDAGYLQTLWLLPVANLVFYGLIIAYVAAGRAGPVGFLADGARQTVVVVKALYTAVYLAA
jgi:hypothetical protein